MLLEIERLTLHFGGLAALNGVNLSVGERELLALIGPNGAGKTCVLNCISGLYRPGAGQIRFNGQDVTGLRPDQVAQLGVGRSFQHVELFRQLNVLQNVLLGRHLHIRSSLILDGIWWGPARREELAHRRPVEQILELLQLDSLADRPVSELPYGVQKLVGIARALAMEPKLLLLDEPSAGMNRQDKEHLARVLLRIKELLHIPMLWVEHDMELVADLADRVQVLHYGQEIVQGRPHEVLRHAEVVRVYLGHSSAQN
ncbi:MAG: ABC transporter ATP-binding protein [Chloroflexi bacterium]|nr:ABC transporter ATP-binding protein [Chloroflexota bacterium]MDA8189853.1 ABC transporter ATP-binding protein [Dehalococcoidales bacterium]